MSYHSYDDRTELRDPSEWLYSRLPRCGRQQYTSRRGVRIFSYSLRITLRYPPIPNSVFIKLSHTKLHACHAHSTTLQGCYSSQFSANIAREHARHTCIINCHILYIYLHSQTRLRARARTHAHTHTHTHTCTHAHKRTHTYILTYSTPALLHKWNLVPNTHRHNTLGHIMANIKLV